MLKLTKIKAFLIEIGEITYFARRFFKELFKKPFEFNELLRQVLRARSGFITKRKGKYGNFLGCTN